MRKASVSIRTIIAVVGLTLAAASLAVAQQPAGAPAARTAAQAYKNIQVLKDIPNTQLIPTMRFISTALGVSVNSATWETGRWTRLIRTRRAK